MFLRWPLQDGRVAWGPRFNARCWHLQVQPKSCLLYCLLPDRLCKDVCQVSLGVHIFDLHSSLLDVIVNEVVLGVDVLEFPVLRWVLADMYAARVIRINCWGAGGNTN